MRPRTSGGSPWHGFQIEARTVPRARSMPIVIDDPCIKLAVHTAHHVASDTQFTGILIIFSCLRQRPQIEQRIVSNGPGPCLAAPAAFHVQAVTHDMDSMRLSDSIAYSARSRASASVAQSATQSIP